jgi:hypothetical protein
MKLWNAPLLYGREFLELWQYTRTPMNTYRNTPIHRIHVFPQLYYHQFVLKPRNGYSRISDFYYPFNTKERFKLRLCDHSCNGQTAPTT